MEKRGLSTIVATVMIIALAVAAAGIIAKFAIPFVREGLSKSTECVDFQEYYKFDENLGFNCVEPDDDLIISVSAQNLDKGGEEIKGFDLILFGDGFSKVTNVREGEMADHLSGYSREEIELPGPGETRSYNYTEREFYNFAELFPVLKSGKICERRSDRIALRRCG